MSVNDFQSVSQTFGVCNASIVISIIIPCKNGAKYLRQLFRSILFQEMIDGVGVEISFVDDHSTDNTGEIVVEFVAQFIDRGYSLVLTSFPDITQSSIGVGAAKNLAVSHSTGQFLCFIDADDLMLSDRLKSQYLHLTSTKEQLWQAGKEELPVLCGAHFIRDPADSTARYTNWANNLSYFKLNYQVFTSFGPTVIAPTWFISKKDFHAVGGFKEVQQGFPEDYEFFLRMKFDHNGIVTRCDTDHPLVVYRYHPDCATFSVHEDTIFQLKLEYLQMHVLSKWSSFTIWNAGKYGKKLYRSLSCDNRRKVVAFCDIDEKKVARGVYVLEDSQERPKPSVPIIHFSKASPPLVLCVKQDFTGGDFETNLMSLRTKEGGQLIEGNDFVHFA